MDVSSQSVHQVNLLLAVLLDQLGVVVLMLQLVSQSCEHSCALGVGSGDGDDEAVQSAAAVIHLAGGAGGQGSPLDLVVAGVSGDGCEAVLTGHSQGAALESGDEAVAVGEHDELVGGVAVLQELEGLGSLSGLVVAGNAVSAVVVDGGNAVSVQHLNVEGVPPAEAVDIIHAVAVGVAGHLQSHITEGLPSPVALLEVLHGGLDAVLLEQGLVVADDNGGSLSAHCVGNAAEGECCGAAVVPEAVLQVNELGNVLHDVLCAVDGEVLVMSLAQVTDLAGVHHADDGALLLAPAHTDNGDGAAVLLFEDFLGAPDQVESIGVLSLVGQPCFLGGVPHDGQVGVLQGCSCFGFSRCGGLSGGLVAANSGCVGLGRGLLAAAGSQQSCQHAQSENQGQNALVHWFFPPFIFQASLDA